MTYSFVHRAINEEAFPKAVTLYDQSMMTGRGRGKYCYRDGIRSEAEKFLREELSRKLPDVPILYIV
jgi:spore photoproduct lyase